MLWQKPLKSNDFWKACVSPCWWLRVVKRGTRYEWAVAWRGDIEEDTSGWADDAESAKRAALQQCRQWLSEAVNCIDAELAELR